MSKCNELYQKELKIKNTILMLHEGNQECSNLIKDLIADLQHNCIEYSTERLLEIAQKIAFYEKKASEISEQAKWPQRRQIYKNYTEEFNGYKSSIETQYHRQLETRCDIAVAKEILKIIEKG